MLRTLLRSILSNWIGFASNVAITLLLTPFVLRHLGDSRYGIWALVTGLTGYFGLFDLGFRAGTTQYLARYLAKRDFTRLNDTASTALVALSGFAAIVAMATTVCAWSAPFVFSISSDAVGEFRYTVLICGGSLACQFVFFPFASVFAATQRYDIATGVAIGTRLVAAGATVVVLHNGYGLVALSAVTAVSDLVGSVIRWRLSRYILPELRVRPARTNLRSVREIASYSVWNAMIDVGTRLIDATDNIVIAVFLPLAAVTPFALAGGVIVQLSNLFVPIGAVFFPAVTQLDSQADTEGVRRVYLAGSRMMYSLSLAVGLIAAALAPGFFRLWIGREGAESDSLALAPEIFSILLVGLMVRTGQRIGYQVLLGTRKNQILAALFAAEGVANLLLSVLLVQIVGLLGVAIGTLVPALVVQGLLHPIVVCRQLRIPLTRYLGDAIARPAQFGIALGVGLVGISAAFTPAKDWAALCWFGLLCSGVALALLLSVGLSEYERSRFVTNPLKRLMLRMASRSESKPPPPAAEVVDSAT